MSVSAASRATNSPSTHGGLRPSAVGAGGATEDLDYFVEMLAGTKDEKKVEQITRKAQAVVTQQKACRRARRPRRPDKFINCEHILEGHQGFVF
jgi:hypothetical protein